MATSSDEQFVKIAKFLFYWTRNEHCATTLACVIVGVVTELVGYGAVYVSYKCNSK